MRKKRSPKSFLEVMEEAYDEVDLLIDTGLCAEPILQKAMVGIIMTAYRQAVKDDVKNEDGENLSVKDLSYMNDYFSHTRRERRMAKGCTKYLYYPRKRE